MNTFLIVWVQATVIAALVLAAAALLLQVRADRRRLAKCLKLIGHQAAEIAALTLKVRVEGRTWQPVAAPRTVMLRNAETAVVNATMPGDVYELRGYNAETPFLAWTRDGRFWPSGTPNPLDIVAVQLEQDGPFYPVSERGVLRSSERVGAKKEAS